MLNISFTWLIFCARLCFTEHKKNLEVKLMGLFTLAEARIVALQIKVKSRLDIYYILLFFKYIYFFSTVISQWTTIEHLWTSNAAENFCFACLKCLLQKPARFYPEWWHKIYLSILETIQCKQKLPLYKCIRYITQPVIG